MPPEPIAARLQDARDQLAYLRQYRDPTPAQVTRLDEAERRIAFLTLVLMRRQRG